MPELRNIFVNWFNSILENKSSIDENREVIEKLNSLQEVREMFATSVEKYGTKVFEQGLEQGLEQGEYKKTVSDEKK